MTVRVPGDTAADPIGEKRRERSTGPFAERAAAPEPEQRVVGHMARQLVDEWTERGVKRAPLESRVAEIHEAPAAVAPHLEIGDRFPALDRAVDREAQRLFPRPNAAREVRRSTCAAREAMHFAPSHHAGARPSFTRDVPAVPS